MELRRFVLNACALVALGGIALPSAAADGDEAMFGLRWGMTTAQVKASGVKLDFQEQEGDIKTYKAPSLPKGLSDFEGYALGFADDKLAKIVAASKDITGDLTGSEGKARYEELKSMIAEKYGSPINERRRTGLKLFEDRDEFYECLKYDGCGAWAAWWEKPTVFITIRVHGKRRGVGYIRIVAEAQPQWHQAMDALKSGRKNSDRQAF
jgi:hypothetical protein